MRMRAERALRVNGGAYYRFSRDDAKNGEHESISNQRKLVRRFAEENGIHIAQEYVDDGFSGTSFERPEWKRLIADVEDGRINTILVKDLSRLGRNYAQAGYYTDIYFAEHGVRLIAVNDNVDTMQREYDDLMPFRHVINDSYSRDISRKIRSSYHSKFLEGSFISGYAPYGYQKDPANKNHLIPDPETAPVVRMMFELAAQGNPPSEIVRRLKEQGILSPLAYRFSKHPEYNPDDYTWRGMKRRPEWRNQTVSKMLKNEIYLGVTAQGKTHKVSYSSQKVLTMEKSQWYRVEDTHEPLVSREIFDRVQNRSIARRKPKLTGFINIFSGVARCADCGGSMGCAGGTSLGKYYLCCSTYRNRGVSVCSSHRIPYTLLYQTVKEDLKSLMKLNREQKKIVMKGMSKSAGTGNTAQQGIERLKNRERELDRIIDRLYEDNLAGRIDDRRMDRMLQKYQSEQRDISAKMAILEAEESRERTQKDSLRAFNALLEKTVDFDELTPDILHEFVDRIEISEGEYLPGSKRGGKNVRKRYEIRIFYKFIGERGEYEIS